MGARNGSPHPLGGLGISISIFIYCPSLLSEVIAIVSAQSYYENGNHRHHKHHIYGYMTYTFF